MRATTDNGPMSTVRLVFPHQLFLEHLDAEQGTEFVLVEDDLFFRQYDFHAQKLILHRASMRRFATRLREAGYAVRHVETSASRSSVEQLEDLLQDLEPTGVAFFDPVDDWLAQRLAAMLDRLPVDFDPARDVWESPNFLTTRGQIRSWFAENSARMQHFYSWQRQRLDVLVDGDAPVGGQWSFDTENRKKLPKGHPVPEVTPAPADAEVTEAVSWVKEAFPDAPGDPDAFAWPTAHDEAEEAFRQFLDERFAEFGPYEDAISAQHPFIFHAVMTPGLNIGLLSPRDVVDRALEEAEQQDIPLPSLEGFLRQVIGWREYMRATYLLWGRAMRTSNRLEHDADLGEGWWTAQVGLSPVDHVVESVLKTGYAHHIERLMVLGNAMCLLRVRPDAAYEWFMEMFVDAYDWVMVPNVYAMSQFAAGSAITTKPYVSGSNYLKKMSDLPKSESMEDWDGLYWAFVEDHREVFESNFRSKMMTRMWDGFSEAKQHDLRARAQPWLED
ncbi:MAG: cryptochrome/photolyase family protein [Ornithinimicrobium sp.]